MARPSRCRLCSTLADCVVHEGDYRSLPKTETVFTMDLKKAIDLLAQPKKGRGKASALKEFGTHAIHQVPVSLFNGPYGPYLKAGKTNIGLPEGMTVDLLTPEKAMELVTEKLGPTASAARGSKKGQRASKLKVTTKSTQTVKKTKTAAKAKEASAPPVASPKVVIKKSAARK